MKLVFKKDEEHQISVFNEVDGKQENFSYVDMIKELIRSRKLDEPDISGGFTDAEIGSIRNMVAFINKEVSAIKKPDITPGL